MSLDAPKRAFFWDAVNRSWRPAIPGEPGEYVFNHSTQSWEFGTIGAEYLWNASTRSWDFGPGGEYVWNASTRSWDRVTAPGYGGRYYWNTTTNSWVPNEALYPAMLVAAGSGSSVYDPSDLTSLYQSRTGGSTGAADAVVGIMLDKAQMGNKTAAAFISGQTELVTNGTFAADTSGWTAANSATLSVVSGSLRVTNGAASFGYCHQALTGLTVNRWYRLTFESAGGTGSGVVSVGTSPGSLTISVTPTFPASVMFQATATTMYLNFWVGGNTSGHYRDYDNISTKEIPGSHALAPSDAARPILRSSGGLYYLDADGTDDWMNVTPTKNLGEQWWHVGGWQFDADNLAAFALSASSNGQIRCINSRTQYSMRNATDSAFDPFTASATLSATHVLTAQQTATNAVSGRVNGANASSAVPIDDSGVAQGLALFTRLNSSFSQGIDGRFYGGVFNTGTITSANRSIVERWVASKCGVALP